jgi:glutaredoxin 3
MKNFLTMLNFKYQKELRRKTMAKVEIYTTNYCPYCKKAKALFSQLGVDFEETDITDNEDDAMNELIKKTGMSTVPQIFINGKFVGGCDDVHALYKSGDLLKML